MAKINGKGVVVTALVAGVASYFSKKENRDKMIKLLSEMKSKQNTLNAEGQHPDDMKYNTIEEIAETAAGDSETKLRENNMFAESGLQTSIIYYNENNQELR